MFIVNKFTILLKVSVPVKKSPPPKNYRTFSNSSDVNFLKFKCFYNSSITWKNPSL